MAKAKQVFFIMVLADKFTSIMRPMKPRLLTESHLYGEIIIKHGFTNEYAELRKVLESTPIPLRPATPFTKGKRPDTPKRQKKKIQGRKAYSLMPIDQPNWNLAIKKSLSLLGWNAQPLAGGVSNETNSNLRGDFVKNKVFVEVEFGNSASQFRDLFKFQIASRARSGDVAVLVLATKRVARFFDSGVASYEQMLSLKEFLSIGIQMPIWIVGLDITDWSELRNAYNRMHEVATENDVSCHSFDVVFGNEEGEDLFDGEKA